MNIYDRNSVRNASPSHFERRDEKSKRRLKMVTLLRGVSVVAIIAGLTPLTLSTVQAQSVNYQGNVTPAPQNQGSADFNWGFAQLTVGSYSGSGTLSVSGGATAEGYEFYVGTKHAGTMTVDGPGSVVSTTAQSQVGWGGQGTLTVSNGGTVSILTGGNPRSAGLGVGGNSGGDGLVNVSGPGSRLVTDASIIIGLVSNAQGAMNITDGGIVEGSELEIGANFGSVGTVNISGAGSAFNGQRGVWVGVSSQNATLNLYDGGSISGRLLEIAQNAGSKGVVNVGGAANGPARAAGRLNVDSIEFNGQGGGSQGVLNLNTTDGVSVRASISGVGTINQIAGRTILTGNGDNFAGVTNITGGVLQLGDGGETGSLAGNISTGSDAAHAGVLVFNRSGILTMPGVISGTGSVIQQGSGTTILTQDNIYTGGTTILSGTLQLGNGGSTGSILDSNVSNDGILAFDRSDSVGFNSVISGSGKVIQRGSHTLTLYGDNSFSGGLDVESGIAKAGIVDHAFGSGVLNVVAGATADLDDFNTTTGGLSGAGNVELRTATLTLEQSDETTFSGTIDGMGGLNKNGSGKLTLSGANSYSGATEVNGGFLIQGSAGALSSASSSYSVGSAGTLELGGFNTDMASLTNQGAVDFGGLGGTILHVKGDYSGGGGVTINSVLGGDGSKTDRLEVDGATSGTTELTVNNQGGNGALTVNGIKVVAVGGNSNGTFVLGNGYTTKDGEQAVVGGAFAYTLQQGGAQTTEDGDWYLVSHAPDPDNPTCKDTNSCPPPAPRYSAGAPVYEGYVQNMMALNKLPTLQQRVGNRYFAGTNLRGSEDGGRAEGASFDARGIWARVEGAHNRLEPSTSTARMKQDINTLEMQAGVDGQFYENDQGRLIAGITGQYGHAKGDVSSQHGDGSIATDAWSLGVAATWYGNDGFYLDGQGQVTWFDNDLDSSTANQSLANGRKATGYAVSLETGRQIPLAGNWSLTPQAQLSWSSISANSFRDAWNARIGVDDGDSLVGRLGLAAQYATAWKDDQGRASQASLYGIANLYQEFLGGTTVDLSGVDFNTDNDRTWGGIGLGGSYAWADNKYALYGEGSINTGLTHFADSYSLKGNVGFKVNW